MKHQRVTIDRFRYRDCWGRSGHCGIEAIQIGGGLVVVIATEVWSNPGMSITNAAEYVATALCRHLDIDPHGLVWIEHYGYPPPAGLPERTYDRVTFARVTPDRSPFFHDPTWTVMRDADWQALGVEPRY